MHIVLVLLGAIGVVAALLWRLRMAVRVLIDLVGAGNGARLFVRRRKANADLLKSVDDPREAAAAQSDGALTEAETAAIIEMSTAASQPDRRPVCRWREAG